MIIKNVLEIIDELFMQDYQPPESYKDLDRALFDYKSYKYWALTELRTYIIKECIHSDVGIFEAVEEFRSLMNQYSCDTCSVECNFIFAVAYDVATDVLDHLISQKQGRNINETKSCVC